MREKQKDRVAASGFPLLLILPHPVRLISGGPDLHICHLAVLGNGFSGAPITAQLGSTSVHPRLFVSLSD